MPKEEPGACRSVVSYRRGQRGVAAAAVCRYRAGRGFKGRHTCGDTDVEPVDCAISAFIFRARRQRSVYLPHRPVAANKWSWI
jgi:hypothetical protein